MRLAIPDDQDDPRFPYCKDPTHFLEDNGEKVGRCMAYPEVNALVIPSFETRSDIRLRGYGRRFLAELEELAKGEGKKFLCAKDLDDQSEPFWERMGFTMSGVLSDDLIMRYREI